MSLIRRDRRDRTEKKNPLHESKVESFDNKPYVPQHPMLAYKFKGQTVAQDSTHYNEEEESFEIIKSGLHWASNQAVAIKDSVAGGVKNAFKGTKTRIGNAAKSVKDGIVGAATKVKDKAVYVATHAAGDITHLAANTAAKAIRGLGKATFHGAGHLAHGLGRASRIALHRGSQLASRGSKLVRSISAGAAAGIVHARHGLAELKQHVQEKAKEGSEKQKEHDEAAAAKKEEAPTAPAAEEKSAAEEAPAAEPIKKAKQ